MAVFECRQYPSMTFFVNGKVCRFAGGVYATDDKDEIEALSKMIDVVRVDSPKAKEAEDEPKKPRGKSSK